MKITITEEVDNIEGNTAIHRWKAIVPCHTLEEAKQFLSYDPCTGQTRKIIDIVED